MQNILFLKIIWDQWYMNIFKQRGEIFLYYQVEKSGTIIEKIIMIKLPTYFKK